MRMWQESHNGIRWTYIAYQGFTYRTKTHTVNWRMELRDSPMRGRLLTVDIDAEGWERVDGNPTGPPEGATA